VPTGDDSQYANPNYSFLFNRLGVRVPGIVVSAYTAKGTLIGDDPASPATVFDHSSVLATVEKRFGLKPLTKRDGAANTLEVALNLAAPRLLPTEAPTTLPNPAADAAAAVPADPTTMFAASAQAPLSTNQRTMSALALACDLQTTPSSNHAALISNHQKLVEQKDAADYIQKVEDKVISRRQAPPDT
jgi:phospholipase C